MKSTNNNPTGKSSLSHRLGDILKNIGQQISTAKLAVAKLLRTDIWDIELTSLPAIKRRVVRMGRIFFLIIRGFKEDECGLHASSLTFMTLLSFVPILALAVSVVRAVSYDDSLREKTKSFVRSLVVEMPQADKRNVANALSVVVVSLDDETQKAERTEGREALAEGASIAEPPSADPVEAVNSSGILTLTKIESLIDIGFDRVEKLNFGALGGIGLLFLIWAVISVLGDVEAAFNRVWGVVENRTLARKFTDYLSVLIICPLLVAAASSLPVMGFIEAKMSAADDAFFISAMAGVPVIRVVWVLFLLTLAFTFMLRFTPNTQVKLKPGFIGGFVAALGFAAWLKICLILQIGVAKYSTFFGGFATVPIILSWVYVSWQILLFGGEVSYAVQNVDSYRMELGWREANQKGKILLAVALMREAAHNIAQGDGLLDLQAFTKKFKISARLVREVAHDLVKSGVIVETAADSNSYAVRRNLDSMDIGFLVNLILEVGVTPQLLGVGALKTSKLVAKDLETAFKTCLTTKIVDLPENISVEEI